jgi:ABC-2 type transport system permease protein
VTYVVPAKYFLIALRGIVLKGSAVGHLTVPLLALAAYAAAMLGLASLGLSRERA